ncbi:MAG: hypothetical protein Ta2F_18200 [Termitinemataceae bacterium]|nr:MAG: hypothetical protein Ta2F_18200 [Termitinemataceae bacterium]
MIILKKHLLFISVILCLISCVETNNSAKVEIPFSLENERMILDATVNGKTGRFLFDTGATISEFKTNKIKIWTGRYVNEKHKGKTKRENVYILNKIYFGSTELNTRSWFFNRTNSITEEEGYDGLLGIGIFAGHWCEISFSKNKIILHKEKPEYYTKSINAFVENKYNYPIFIPVIVDDNIFNFEIDTGLSQGIYFPNDIVKFKTSSDYKKIITNSEVKDQNLVRTNSISILDEIYNNRFVITNSYVSARRNPESDDNNNNAGILGIKFLKYYDILLDLRNLRDGKTTDLYYDPNTAIDERNYGFFTCMKEQPQFGITSIKIYQTYIEIRAVIQDSIAYNKFSIKPGTIITKVNGKPIKEFSLPELQDPSFYLTIDNYTILENGLEKTITSKP